jgi:hypothetical protein
VKAAASAWNGVQASQEDRLHAKQVRSQAHGLGGVVLGHRACRMPCGGVPLVLRMGPWPPFLNRGGQGPTFVCQDNPCIADRDGRLSS